MLGANALRHHHFLVTSIELAGYCTKLTDLLVIALRAIIAIIYSIHFVYGIHLMSIAILLVHLFIVTT